MEVNFSSRNNFVNLGSLAKVFVSVESIIIPGSQGLLTEGCCPLLCRYNSIVIRADPAEDQWYVISNQAVIVEITNHYSNAI